MSPPTLTGEEQASIPECIHYTHVQRVGVQEMSVRFVNCFQVQPGVQEEVFLERWREIRAYMTKKPGFLSGRLHRSLNPAAKYRFVNYVEWETAELHAAAHDQGFREFMKHPTWTEGLVTSTPALYDVVSEY
jgi:heme-degrading monooxygenase HmoA